MEIIVSGGYAKSLVNFRLPLLKSFRDRGFQVWTTAADEQPWITERLAREGIQFRPAPVQRAGLNPFADWRYLRFLRDLVAEVKPEIVLGYTHKAAIYSSLAAGSARSFSLITGLGYAFMESQQALDPKRALARGVLCRLYKRALRRNELTFFQNEEDREEFVRRRLVSREKTKVVNGSGVDLAHFQPAELPSEPVFLLIARLLTEKGIREYHEAAKAVKQESPEARFFLVGGLDPNPAALSKGELDAWVGEGVIEYQGELQDVRPAIREASVYVLPSFYREGTPRTILEGMAMGRPIITSDAPGCRNTVEEGVNGFLIPTRNAEALANAMRRFVHEPALIPKMGQESLRLAREKYDVHKVNADMLAAMGIEG